MALNQSCLSRTDFVCFAILSGNTFGLGNLMIWSHLWQVHRFSPLLAVHRLVTVYSHFTYLEAQSLFFRNYETCADRWVVSMMLTSDGVVSSRLATFRSHNRIESLLELVHAEVTGKVCCLFYSFEGYFDPGLVSESAIVSFLVTTLFSFEDQEGCNQY